MQIKSFWNLLLSPVTRGGRGAGLPQERSVRPWYVLSSKVRNHLQKLGARVEVTADFGRPYRHVLLRTRTMMPPLHAVQRAHRAAV